ncbi:MAG: DUF4315 family protein [Butyrivibrio sp.]|nr:DUF4315 family protein [Butyrivibrio sp.]
MYERIERLREDLERARKRKAEAEQRVKTCESRLREAENNQILAEVGALKLKPEEVARLLQLAQEKEKTGQGAASVFERASASTTEEKTVYTYDDESEDLEDEEN